MVSDGWSCRWCGRSGPVVTIDDDLDYDSIMVITNRDLTVHPPAVRKYYVCYECRIWENAIEERCHQQFGVCTDTVRAAAMQRYLEQGRWLSIADLNEVARQVMPPAGFVGDNLGLVISPYGDTDEEEKENENRCPNQD